MIPIAFFAVATILGLLTWAIILYFKEDERIIYPLLINTMSQYTNGYAKGRIISIETVNNRKLVEFMPTDLSDEQKKKNIKVKNQFIVYDKDKLITLPKGTLSNYEDIHIGIAPTAEDFNTQLKNTELGMALMGLTESISNKNDENKYLRISNKLKTKLLQDMPEGEISEKWIDRHNEQTENIIKRGMDAKSSPSSTVSSYHPPQFPPK